MAQLRHDYREFTKREAEILAVAPDEAKALTDFWHKERIPFIGLSDPNHRVADLYRQEVNPLKLGRMPALFVVDKNGSILFQHYNDSMSDIISNETVLKILDTAEKNWTLKLIYDNLIRCYINVIIPRLF